MATTLGAMSSMRAFNRFELKYLIGRDRIGAVKADLAENLVLDPNGGPAGYTVWSRYYDTADLLFYWQKIDGIRFRRKVRIRHYGETQALEGATPVFVEIKQRVNRVTQKMRVRLEYAAALALCDDHERPDMPAAGDQAVADQILALVAGKHLEPAAIVGYRRLAMVGTETDGGLRVTFDSYVRGRTTDLDLHAQVATESVLSPDIAIVEVKVNERVPYWLTDKIARHNMQLIRISKYCTSVEGIARPGLRLRSEGKA